jgi:hypothetical protein
MAASTSGTKTVTKDAAPHLTASQLTTLLALPIESLTVKQFRQIADALSRVKSGGDESQTVGSVLV